MRHRSLPWGAAALLGFATLLLAGCSSAATSPHAMATAARPIPANSRTQTSEPVQPTLAPGASGTPAPRQYTVQAGDTLGLIAQRFQTSVATLRDLNGISGDTIRPGQSLAIPAAAPAVTVAAQPSLPSPDSTTPATVITRGRTDTNAVALTFDAGADVGYTKLILETLKRNSIHASFGMTGQWATDNPDLVKQIAADGHQLLNHTWDHASFTGTSFNVTASTRAERWSELDRTEALIRRLTGRSTLPYFRAPFGDQDASVEADVGLRGYRYDILWTVDTRGWAKAPVAQIVATSSSGAAPGAIYVMHVGGDSQDGPALQGVIDAIRQKGLGFATVDQLVGGR